MGEVIDVFRREERQLLTIFEVAATFLTLESMDPKKLQKLCYYAQAWYLAFYKRRLMAADFEAWIHGPVCPELYHAYKSYGWNEIPKEPNLPSRVNKATLEFIQDVYETYREFSGNDLECMTHMERPWIEARAGVPDIKPCHTKISDQTISDYYWSVYEQNQGE